MMLKLMSQINISDKQLFKICRSFIDIDYLENQMIKITKLSECQDCG